MQKRPYVCPKCGGTHYETDTIQTTGGNFSKIFDVQNKKFTAVICSSCGYTEFYRRANSTGWDILDFLINH